MRLTLLLIFAFLCALASAQISTAQTYTPPVLQQYDSRYYMIYTDLDETSAREIVLRMTKMAEEYKLRTAPFGRMMSTAKLPFYVFRKELDYNEAGGTENSGGVFTGDKLLAWAGDRMGPMSWHIIQHEGFHQFAKATIGDGLPIWCNEGMAEYFGEGLFTGDGFATGLIPQERLERLRTLLKTGSPADHILTMSHGEWNSQLAQGNYDVAWSMVHFLAHGDNNRYQPAFMGYIKAAGAGQDPSQAWQKFFGPPAAFEARWKQYWLELPDDPTGEAYDRAAVSAVTSMLARAVMAHKPFSDLREMMRGFDAGEVMMSETNWLPASLLHTALKWTKGGKWTIDNLRGNQVMVLTRSDGCRVVGSFTISGSRVMKITTDLDDLPKAVADARKLIADGKISQGKSIILQAIRKHPYSSAIAEARDVLQGNSRSN